MPPRVQLLEQIVKQLKGDLTPKVGLLFGTIYEGYTLVTGCSFACSWDILSSIDLTPDTNEAVPTDTHDDDNVSYTLYPNGLDFLGLINIAETEDTSPHDIAVPKFLKNISVTANPIYIKKSLKSEFIDVFYLRGDDLCETEYETLPYNKFLEKFVYIILKGTIPFNMQMQNDCDDYAKEIDDLSERVCAGVIFCLAENDLTIHENNIHNELRSSIGKVFDSSSKSVDFVSGVEVLNATAFLSSSVDIEEGIEYGAPYALDCSCGDCEIPRKLAIPVDVLCAVYRERSLNDVHNLLTSALVKELMFYGIYLNKHMGNTSKIAELEQMEVKHFFNDLLGIPISIRFLDNDEEALCNLRKDLHENINAPLDRPLFRKANCLKFIPTSAQPDVLLNVHVGLKQQPSKSPNCKIAYVYGKYEYYHYGTENFDDKNWGCAYRSFQTIFSWFRIQGYTEAPVPTHLEVQKTLVEIGDKEKQFIGSKTWIGTTEVSYVLQSKLDVNSRIICLSSGYEMNTIGQALFEHFEYQGTPVMIGGGVLAHTIIGVSIDEDSGETRFLVLDPHYTGKHQLSAIQKSGFVGWKAPNFWNANTYYNLCLPLRPICF